MTGTRAIHNASWVRRSSAGLVTRRTDPTDSNIQKHSQIPCFGGEGQMVFTVKEQSGNLERDGGKRAFSFRGGHGGCEVSCTVAISHTCNGLLILGLTWRE